MTNDDILRQLNAARENLLAAKKQCAALHADLVAWEKLDSAAKVERVHDDCGISIGAIRELEKRYE